MNSDCGRDRLKPIFEASGGKDAERGFSPCPIAVLSISMPNLDKLLLVRLLGYRGRNAIAAPGYDRLASDLGASKREVARSAKSLEDGGFLTITRDAYGKPVAFEIEVDTTGPFIAVPNELFGLDLTHGPKLMLIRLLMRGHSEKVAVAKLARGLAVSSDTIRRWTLVLRQRGLLLLVASQGRRPNTYRPTSYVQRWNSEPSQNWYAIRDPEKDRTRARSEALNPDCLMRLAPWFRGRKLCWVGSRVVFALWVPWGKPDLKLAGADERRLRQSEIAWVRRFVTVRGADEGGLLPASGLGPRARMNRAAMRLLFSEPEDRCA